MLFRVRAVSCAYAAVVGLFLFAPAVFGAYLPGAENCAQCHSFNPTFSHPVNIVPSMRVPDRLPLDDGKLTCVTCHTVTGPEHTTAGDPQLRMAAGQLCMSCHANTPLRDQLRHGANIGRAHLARSSQKVRQAGQLDAESRNCMSCHDGSMASDAGTIRAMDASAIDAEHPIGNVYNKPARESALAPSMMLNAQIRLLDGKVGCGSCHSPYSTEKSHLVMANNRAQLCMSCHQL